jgi:hypothetical protein
VAVSHGVSRRGLIQGAAAGATGYALRGPSAADARRSRRVDVLILGRALPGDLDELGQGELGDDRRLAAQLRLDHLAIVLERGGLRGERALAPALAAGHPTCAHGRAGAMRQCLPE